MTYFYRLGPGKACIIRCSGLKRFWKDKKKSKMFRAALYQIRICDAEIFTVSLWFCSFRNFWGIQLIKATMIICNTTIFCSLWNHIVSSQQVKHHVCWDNFIRWCRLWKLSDYLYEMVAGKSIVVNKRKKERGRDRESRLKEWEKQHRRRSEMAWVGSDHRGGHLRIWRLTEWANVNLIQT